MTGGFGRPENSGGFGNPGGQGGFGQPGNPANQGGFGQPQGWGNPTNSRAQNDYRFADSHSSISPQKPKTTFADRMRNRVSYRAPWPLLVAATLQLGSTGWVIYQLRTLTNRSDNYTELVISWTIVLTLLIVAAVLTLKGENLARLALTVLCVTGVLLLAWGGFAPVGLLSLITVVLLWLPTNRTWFGHH